MDSKELPIWSILDDRLDRLVQEPFEKRSDQLTPALKDALILALWDNHDVDAMRVKLETLRKNQTDYRKFEQPKHLIESQKRYYKEIFSALELPDVVYDHTRYIDFVEYENSYKRYPEEMKLLYIRAWDVMRHLMEKYQYADSEQINRPIQIDNTDVLQQGLLDRLYGKAKQQTMMSLRHYMRERYTYFILPTPERPYAVHPSYIFAILEKYNHSYFSKKNSFSGMMWEIWGNYCLSWYEDNKQSMERVDTRFSDAIVADMFLKTDEVYKFTKYGNQNTTTWEAYDNTVIRLAVDFKVKWFLQESFCKYDSHHIDKDAYELYKHKRAHLLRHNLLNIPYSEILCHMESHVNWWTVDGTLFTLKNMKERRYIYVKSFLKSMPYSSIYEKNYIGDHYKHQQEKRQYQEKQQAYLQKNPLYIEIEDYEDISKDL